MGEWKSVRVGIVTEAVSPVACSAPTKGVGEEYAGRLLKEGDSVGKLLRIQAARIEGTDAAKRIAAVDGSRTNSFHRGITMEHLLLFLMLASCATNSAKPVPRRDPQYAPAGGQSLVTAYESRIAVTNGTAQFFGNPFAYELALQDKKVPSNYGFHVAGNNVYIPLVTFCADFDAPIAPPGKLFEASQPNALNLPRGTLFRVSNQFYNELIVPSEKLGQNSDIFIPAGAIFTFNPNETFTVSVAERLGSETAHALDALEKVDLADPNRDRIRERDLLQHIVWDAVSDSARTIPDKPVKTSGGHSAGTATTPPKTRRDRIYKIVISTYPQATDSQQKSLTDQFEKELGDLEKRVRQYMPARNPPHKPNSRLIAVISPIYGEVK